ncbi:MAG TPA: MFS transporter [Pseudonocardiaceae bacterium]|jgi:MFS family permease|nr:MFS transporter [Pseudonocardiaceae bacterium]
MGSDGGSSDPDRVTFRSVFAVREFRALWSAEALSQIGDQLARVALAVLVFQRTDSALLTGLTYALTMAPAFLGGIFLSGIADRLPRREVMVAADLARAVLIAAVAIPGMPFPALWVLVAAVSFCQAPFKAAQLALLPALLPGDKYVTGMAIRSITIQTAQMIGFAAGGVLISAINPYLGLALDAVTFLGSAAFVRFGVHHRPAAQVATEGVKRESMVRSAAGGLRLIWGDASLRTLLTLSWLSGFLIVYEGLAAPYTAEIGGGTIAIGLILASDPLGSAIGAFVFGRWVPVPMRAKVLGALGIASCVPVAVVVLHPGLVLSVALFALAGALGTAVMMQSTALFTRAVPDHSRAQASGLSQSGTATIQGLSPLLAGLVADHVGTANTVGAVGIIGLLIAVPAAIVWQRILAGQAGVVEQTGSA